ncbi:MAG: molecular chaperone [Pseudomonas sp.]|nr:molecular chaperone [Pseudomonas sp.]
MDKQSPHLLLRVPTPQQQQLTFCEPNPRELKRWVAGLPKANLGETARLLYQALVELNQLACTADTRLQLLELLRPEVYYVCKHLERHFLNQAVVLDERPRKVANLCQALQNHLAIGYKLIVVQEVGSTAREPLQRLVTALQRASHSLCGSLIRASQLYCPVPEGLWLELHQLYQIGCNQALQHISVRDEQAQPAATPSLSLEQTYLVALLLGCARCNQMRQSGIARLAEALEPWCALAKLQPASLASSLFAIAPLVDGPPRYKSLFPVGEQSKLLGIDSQPLADAIREYLLLPVENRKQSQLQVPDGFSLDVLQHLGAAWGDISERTFQRNNGQGTLTLSIGMSSVHYFIAGQVAFSEVLKKTAHTVKFSAQAVDSGPDIWGGAFDAQRITQWEPGLPMEEIVYRAQDSTKPEPVPAEEETVELYPTYNLTIINHSPGGYCLSWPKEVPGQLQAGEILGLQDSPEQAWSVAVVRWIRQVRGGGTQMGIELVAPFAQPCGLQLMRKTEQHSQFLRALLLPAIAAISRPATLITPRLPFQEGNKVLINLNGNEQRAVLSRKQTSTGSFTQFEYRNVELSNAPQGKPVTAPSGQVKAGEEDFDSLWKSL